MRANARIPSKISPCPIIDSIFELRFETSLPDEAVFGYMYSKISEKCTTWTQLPIVNLPKDLRNQDPNLRYAPHYQCKVGDFVYKIGPNVIAVTNPGDYKGWKIFSEEVKWFYERVIDSAFIKSFSRIGFRCVNYFDRNVFDLIDGSTGISFEGYSLLENSHVLSLQKGEYFVRIALMNNAKVQVESNVLVGGLFDIDVSLNTGLKFDDILTQTDSVHGMLKEIFFSTLKEDVVNGLNPEYSNEQ